MSLTLYLDLPADLSRLRLPSAVAARLQSLLDRQEIGYPLTDRGAGRSGGLVDLADLLTLPRTRSECASS